MQSVTRARSRGLIVVAAVGALALTAAFGSSWLFAAMTGDTAECSRANALVQEASSYLGQPVPSSVAEWRETASNLNQLADQLRRIKVLDHGERLADAADDLADVASQRSDDGWSTAREQLRQRLVGLLDACGLSAG